jgi:hypothetical protein
VAGKDAPPDQGLVREIIPTRSGQQHRESSISTSKVSRLDSFSARAESEKSRRGSTGLEGLQGESTSNQFSYSP